MAFEEPTYKSPPPSDSRSSPDEVLDLKPAASGASGDTVNYTGQKRGNIFQGKKGITAGPKTKECYRCLGKHLPADCKYCDATCHRCKRKGHIAPACRTAPHNIGGSGPPKPRRAHYMSPEPQEDDVDTFSTYNMSRQTTEPQWFMSI